ncbi:hypothetical protein CA600_12580 [Paenibacillus sp. VTT E-133280]|uniref:hypothetical protein n=1 Tax=Paenibacillus sp. VTT E-133280 TaxID=1986222 RepID=UPI000BA03658|nr:hypothetical protein [Paenibacillus sp. VTT E-133280]OZQ66089.1 hypothetical protein CA600_12580 [Paenibacillus sp. VTT E-133280]
MNIKKVVFLEENMLDEHEREIFQSDVPYLLEQGYIHNEDGLKMSLNKIWVDFRLVHQKA